MARLGIGVEVFCWRLSETAPKMCNLMLFSLRFFGRSMTMTDTISQRIKELFDSGYYCAESVLLTVAEAYDIQSGLIPKIATGFCAGISRTSNVCGAVTGGVMAVGLLMGRNLPTEPAINTYIPVQEFIDRFEEAFGSTNCRVLTGCDLNTPEGQNYFKTKDLLVKCRKYTEEATRIAISIIESDKNA
jgi:C_GCAxxG_C_C family probable redox protein